ncbi:MAG: adenine nucleotide alpha hydrolase family protein [Deltaproteobacteria bacterium]|nr:adenine nucleotide alpha hydrolase family protein [Deltaproteobacteria bacterium]MBI3389700.1 adenine nucleotide alpha hydrolase family protein [Deltaproteobacteria bacterium]
MKCTRCRERAEVHLRQHNSAFCRGCFQFFFHRQVERAIQHEHMFTLDDEVLVAVSGGKDSLALWDVLIALGYRTVGVHLALGIGEYSATSTEKTERFARARGLRLIKLTLADEGPGLAIANVANATNRKSCAACGTVKRHYFDQLANEHGFRVVATGHNLDDEAARLLGNVLHWQTEHLAKQHPVLEPNHEKFSRKVKPLFRVSEYETAVYAFFRGIDYVIDECPNSVGATQLIYKDVLNRLEAAMPGTKLTFVKEFLRSGRPAFVTAEALPPPQSCEGCGMPSFGTLCSFCRLSAEVERKQGPAHVN